MPLYLGALCGVRGGAMRGPHIIIFFFSIPIASIVVRLAEEKQDASDKIHQISDCHNELATINVLLFVSVLGWCGESRFFFAVRSVFIVESA